MANNQAATDLRAIADHIERVGLNQNGNNFSSGNFFKSDRQKYEPCCVYGAGYVLGISSEKEKWRAALAARVGRLIGAWSDTAPESEVLATLRAVADELESEAVER